MSLRPNYRSDSRRMLYKSLHLSPNAETGRKKREGSILDVRKRRKEESLRKKRKEELNLQQLPLVSHASIEETLQNLPSLVSGIWTVHDHLQLDAASLCLTLVSCGNIHAIEEVIEVGVVSRLVEFLARDGFPQLQHVAAWGLTNIASGTSENTKTVVDHEAVPAFVRLLRSPVDDVREQAVWALGNIAGDSSKFRDIILENGALVPLLALLNEHNKLSMIRNATWALSNFCRNKPMPPFQQIKPALPLLARLTHSTDPEVVMDACWGISYLCDGDHDRVQAVIESGVCPRLVELLVLPGLIVPVLRIIGNIAMGNMAQTQCIVDQNILPHFLDLLSSRCLSSGIKKEVCWVISNIAAGSKEQIQAIIDAGLIATLINLIQTADLDTKKEAVWAISNALSGGTPEQVKEIASQECISPLCHLLSCSEPMIIRLCLNGLNSILSLGEAENSDDAHGVNIYAQMIEGRFMCLDRIEDLYGHENDDICTAALMIVERYWPRRYDSQEGTEE